MASTNFVNGTVVQADWLNDVNKLAYGDPSGASMVGFIQSGTGAVARTLQDKGSDAISIFDFMTPAQIADVKARTYAIDVSDAVITAVIASQWAAKELLAPSGGYKITKEIPTNNTLSFRMKGEGCGSFDGSGVLNETGTVFALFTPGINLFKVRTNQQVRDSLSAFACVNKSGVKAGAVAIDGQTSTFCSYADITVSGFEYGYRGEKNLYISFDRIIQRNTDYGLWLMNVSGTPPLTLNATFFNNVVSIRDCAVVGCKVGYSVAGVGVDIKNVDATNFSEAGISIGGDDYNVSTFTLDQIYTEGGAGVPILITNAHGSIGTHFIGQPYALAMSIKNSRVMIDAVYAYASVTNLIDNNNSRIWLGYYAGAVSNSYTNTNGGKTFVHQLQQPVESSTAFTLTQGQSIVIPSAVMGNFMTELTIRFSDNGTLKIQKYILRTNSTPKRITTEDTPSAYLSVTSALNVATGRYDVTMSNTAAIAWDIDVTHYAFHPLNIVR